MAKFFDKIGELAKTAADKTGDIIEQNRLGSKISAEEAAITELKAKIGNFYWEKFLTDGTADADILEWCEAIKTARETIVATQAEIQALKEEKPTETAAVQTSAEVSCPSCKTGNPVGTKFCKECGAKLEPQEPATVKCPACGVENPPDTKFCRECGGKLL